MFVNSVFDDIVQVLSNGANAYVPTYHRNFFKFWWNEELAALKESSIESNEVEKPLANAVLVLFLTDGRLVDLHILGVSKNVKEAVLKCILTSCMRLYSVNIVHIFGKDGGQNLSL